MITHTCTDYKMQKIAEDMIEDFLLFARVRNISTRVTYQLISPTLSPPFFSPLFSPVLLLSIKAIYGNSILATNGQCLGIRS
jgi:hypothetical protein